MLFSLFTNHLDTYLMLKENNVIYFKNNMCNYYVKLHVLVLLYADYTILPNSAADLQKGLDNLSSYCMEWKLQVNSRKNKIIIFSKRRPRN